MGLDRLWAGWRSGYVSQAVTPEDELEGCVLCRVLEDASQVVWRGELAAVVINAFPYNSGHVMAVPLRHTADLDGLEPGEAAAVWAAVTDAVRAIRAAYEPHGFNLGANLGRRGGAGVPGHLHLHVLPRWEGDTNFMSTVAETRVLPEPLGDTRARLAAAWPP